MIQPEREAMGFQKPVSKRYFTDAARAAAVEARRRKRETAIPRQTPEVYVVRMPGACLQFGWEIRRFGAVVLERAETSYPTMQDARTAGETTLARQRVGT